MPLRSSPISMDGYGSETWNFSRCRPALSIKTNLANRRKFFFTRATLVQSITDIALLNFWLMLLSWMFISSYATIYSFCKKIYTFSSVYVSVNTIFECLYLFIGWERSHQLSTHATVPPPDAYKGVIQNAISVTEMNCLI